MGSKQGYISKVATLGVLHSIIVCISGEGVFTGAIDPLRADPSE